MLQHVDNLQWNVSVGKSTGRILPALAKINGIDYLSYFYNMLLSINSNVWPRRKLMLIIILFGQNFSHQLLGRSSPIFTDTCYCIVFGKTSNKGFA